MCLYDIQTVKCKCTCVYTHACCTCVHKHACTHNVKKNILPFFIFLICIHICICTQMFFNTYVYARAPIYIYIYTICIRTLLQHMISLFPILIHKYVCRCVSLYYKCICIHIYTYTYIITHL